jgi:6-phosphogluconolactonase
MSSGQPGDPSSALERKGPDRLLRVYVGTRPAESGHIHCLSLDMESAVLTELAPPHPADHPSFVALHPDGGTLYTVNEFGRRDAEDHGAVSSFTINRKAGGLTFLNHRSSGGAAPCHVKVAAEGRRLFVCNYWGGSLSAFPIAADGSIGPVAVFVQHVGGATGLDRDPGPHAHWASPTPGGRHLFVADLGRDEVLSYRSDAGGMPIADACDAYRFPAGTGPRHAVFVAGGRRLAVACELASSVALLDCDPETGHLAPGPELSTLPNGWSGNNAVAEICVSPDEKFLYASNRGHDSIAIFKLDISARTMVRTEIRSTVGVRPRHFAIDPSGRVLIVANQGSNALAVFYIDRDSGDLHWTGSTYAVPAPTCVAILAGEGTNGPRLLPFR